MVRIGEGLQGGKIGLQRGKTVSGLRDWNWQISESERRKKVAVGWKKKDGGWDLRKQQGNRRKWKSVGSATDKGLKRSLNEEQ